MDLIRALLLDVEAAPRPELPEAPDYEGWDLEGVMYHVRLLRDAGFLTAMDGTSTEGEWYQDLALTWPGHEFLEEVRDPEIWKKTKQGASKLGTWSLSVLGALAKAAIAAKAKELGVGLTSFE